MDVFKKMVSWGLRLKGDEAITGLLPRLLRRPLRAVVGAIRIERNFHLGFLQLALAR